MTTTTATAMTDCIKRAKCFPMPINSLLKGTALRPSYSCLIAVVRQAFEVTGWVGSSAMPVLYVEGKSIKCSLRRVLGKRNVDIPPKGARRPTYAVIRLRGHG